MCALYKQGHVWWYAFKFQRRRIQESTGMTNKTVAQEAETIRKAALLERRAGIIRKSPPKFEEYVPVFLKWSEQQHRRNTFLLHRQNCDTLLRHFSGTYLDEINPGMVEDFKAARIREEHGNAQDGSTVGPATVDRRCVFNPFGKIRAAKRTVPMTEQVWDLLKQRVIATRGCYVFLSARNPDKPIGGVRKAHDAAVARAGIEQHFRLYELRHTYASRAAMAGVDLPTPAALLGHTKIQMTLRYVHFYEEHKREAAAKVEKFKAAEMEKFGEKVRASLQFSLQ